MSSNQVINLEKFTRQSKIVISEAQELADEMRHSKVTLLHLRASVDSFITMEQVLRRTTPGFRRYFEDETIKKFQQLSEIDARYNNSLVWQLNKLPKDAPGPKTAYLTADFIRLLKFSEEKAEEGHVTLKILLHELFCTMREF